MNICIISENYPADGHPFYAFVENLCVNITKEGHRVIVIAPQSLTKILIRGVKRLPYKSVVNGVTIFRPIYVTVGRLSNILNYFFFRLAVGRVFLKNYKEIDVCYGHFWHSAYNVYPFAKMYNIPLFVATGECEIELHKYVRSSKLDDFIDYVKGVICVSTKNKEESLAAGLTTLDKCIVIPNAIDDSIFKLLDKIEARRHYNISKEDFVVAFVGGFIQRKGPGRLAAAIDMLNDDTIKAIFIGYSQNGIIEYPDCKGIVFRGQLDHDEIPIALNAADVFVMPTLHEGCCNAIIEAMACGLPIISSDRSFNYDVLNESNSILIDPRSVEEIASAIQRLRYDKETYRRLRAGAIATSQKLTIKERSRRIIEFIKNRI